MTPGPGRRRMTSDFAGLATAASTCGKPKDALLSLLTTACNLNGFCHRNQGSPRPRSLYFEYYYHHNITSLRLHEFGSVIGVSYDRMPITVLVYLYYYLINCTVIKLINLIKLIELFMLWNWQTSKQTNTHTLTLYTHNTLIPSKLPRKVFNPRPFENTSFRKQIFDRMKSVCFWLKANKVLLFKSAARLTSYLGYFQYYKNDG